VYPIRILFPILVVVLVLTYLLDPLVTRLEQRGIRRGWGTALLYVLFLLLAGTAIALLVPIVTEQVRSFAASVPALARGSVEGLHGFLDRLGIDVSFSEVLAEVQQGQSVAASFFERVTSIAGDVAHVLFILVLGPILAFYVIVDLPKIRTGLGAAIPARRQQEWRPVLDRIAAAIGGFFRGQLLVASFVAVASMVVLWAVGLPYWAVVGLIAGVFNLVPMIGPYIGGVVAIFIAITADRADVSGLFKIRPGLGLAIASAIALLIVQQIDNHVVSPNIVARTVKLHPVTVMVSLIAFGTLFGFWGLLLAVPVVATAKILLLHYWDTHVQWPPDEAEADGAVPEKLPADGKPPPAKGRLRRLGRRLARAGGRDVPRTD
jgi:predicted PurR-regulated permease PerM